MNSKNDFSHFQLDGFHHFWTFSLTWLQCPLTWGPINPSATCCLFKPFPTHFKKHQQFVFSKGHHVLSALWIYRKHSSFWLTWVHWAWQAWPGVCWRGRCWGRPRCHTRIKCYLLAEKILSFKGTPIFFYRWNLIFWIVMGVRLVAPHGTSTRGTAWDLD